MWMDWLWVGGGFVLLFGGADVLIRGSVRLSIRSGLSPLVIGLTVVAFGTSTPELFVSLRANFTGNGDIAAGNIVGSNIFNIAVILGIASLLQPIKVKSQLVLQDIPVMIGATLLFFVMSRDMALQRTEGGILFALLLVYVVMTVWLAKKDNEPEVLEEFGHLIPVRQGKFVMDLLMVAGGIALLLVGSNFLVTGAVHIAEAAGVSPAIIGLTLVAAGTGLPELATSVVAAIKKEADIAVGNVIGSNIFNLLCIGGLSPLIKPLRFPELELSDFAVMTVLSVLLLPLAWTRMRLGRREGCLLLACYAAYLYYIWPHAR